MEYEIHITVADFKKEKKQQFIDFCLSEKVKPVIIILDQGNYIVQPMMTWDIYKENFEDAMTAMNGLVKKFKMNGFDVLRKKVEVSPKETTYFENPLMEKGKPYYEWHGKIEVDDLEKVKILMNDKGGHISKNSLSKNGKSRFITMRDYTSAESYYKRVDMIIETLQKNNIELLEEEYELCIYDTREELDNGWVNK